MPSLTLNNRLIWFAHCPKAGGTSVERLMIEGWGAAAVGHLHWGWDRWWHGGGWRTAWPPNSPQHLIWEDAQAILLRDPTHVFAVVRDPLTRMQSEQRWQRMGRRGRRLGKLLAYLPFSIWLRLMLRIVRTNPYAYDNHLRPQVDFVPAHAQIFRLEGGLGPVAEWLARVAPTGRDVPRLPHELHGGAKADVHPRDAALIADAFAPDYARFGYPHPRPMGTARFIPDAMALMLSGPVRWLERRGRI